ncbi:hypothetical protein ACHQM5_026719 [Ranunculus cassubicifolius]
MRSPSLCNLGALAPSFTSTISTSPLILYSFLVLYRKSGINASPINTKTNEAILKKQPEEGSDPDDQIWDTFMLPSEKENIETLLEWIKDADSRVIEIHGEEGTGKNWIARQLMDRAARLFEVCIWVKSNRASTAMKKIAAQLHVDLHSDEIDQVLRETHFLLILDSSLPLDSLDVPFTQQCSKASKYVRIVRNDAPVLTSGRGFSPHEVLKLKRLPKDQAWLLFKTFCGSEPILESHLSDAPQLLQPFLSYCDGQRHRIMELARTLRELSLESFSSSELLVGTKFLTCQKSYRDRLNPSLEYGEDLPEEVNMRNRFFCCAFYQRYHRLTREDFLILFMKSGFLDGLSCLEEAVEKGRNLLVGLGAHNGIVQDDIYVPVTGIDLSYLSRCARGDQNDGQGPSDIILIDGNLDEVIHCGHETCLLYGNDCHPDVLPDGYFEQLQSLKDVSLLHIGIKALPTSVSMLSHLKVLVVRNCISLENVNHIRGLVKLEVLSLSGCSSLKEIPDDLFKDMNCLENLDLSSTHIKKLPSSFSNLGSLRYLTLRDCSHLKALPTMEECNRLLLLDLSKTLVSRLPSASTLSSLQYLILRGCSLIKTVPHPYTLPLLRLLDLSGSGFCKFQETAGVISFLVTLDLSKTKITHIPPLSKCFKLQDIQIDNCPNLETLHSLGSNIRKLDLSNSTSFRNLPTKYLRLKYLDLSRTMIREISSLYLNPDVLILKHCKQLEELPELNLNLLYVLDLSGSTNFQKLDITYCYRLQRLDLSSTMVEELPCLLNCKDLQYLVLKGCLKLETLPKLSDLRDLVSLDVSGSTAFKHFQDDSLGEMESFQELDLSGTQIIQIPILSGCQKFSKLILKDCSKLETLPQLESLSKLQVLDISGVTSVKSFPGQSFVTLPSFDESKEHDLDPSGDNLFSQFQDMSIGNHCVLEEVDLSRTRFTDFSFLSSCKNLSQLSLRGCLNADTTPFKCMPSLQKLDLSETPIEVLSSSILELKDLRQLIMKDCSRLTMLPHLKELTILQVLDLSGGTSFSQILREVLGDTCTLQNIDISRTKITDFSFLSKCQHLLQLSLRGCSNLETLSFEGLLDLHMLDLSESLIEVLSSSVLELHNLRQLFLRSCSRLRMLPHLEKLAELKVLDISGTSIKFPAGISKLIHLWYLGVMNRKFLWSLDWELTRKITEQLNLESCEAESYGKSCLHITVSSTDIFRFMERNIELWCKCVQKFHFCLCSTEEWRKEKDIYLQENVFLFKDIYYQTYNIPQLTDEPDNFLKICGFRTFPDGIELKNDFIRRLSDLGAHNVKVMRECWIERCDDIETLFIEEEIEDNLTLGRCLENLWVSNLSHLECLFEGVMPSGSFNCLKHVYIDCCPRLTSLFSSYLELNMLEKLEIKFCDQLVSIFRDRSVSGEQTLPRLKTIVLCKLPKLQSICRGVLPSLELLQVKGCPELKDLPAMGKTLLQHDSCVSATHSWRYFTLIYVCLFLKSIFLLPMKVVYNCL